MSEHVTPEAAERLVQAVRTWYSEQFIAEQRVAVPDPERLKYLTARLAQCAADEETLEDPEPDEVAEIAARYAARLKELSGQ